MASERRERGVADESGPQNATAPARSDGGPVARIRDLLWGVERGGVFVRAVREIAASLWKFDRDRCFLRASALTYTTLLSLVPLLALSFSLLKGLGAQESVEPLLLEHLAVGNQEVISRILGYVDRTKVGALGAVGLVTLLFTAVSVLGNIELSFNDIWQVQRGRNFIRKVSDYLALLVVGPVLLLASLSLTTTLQSPALLDRLSLIGRAVPFLVRVLPFLAVWLSFVAMYLIMPNRRVPLPSALLGGIVAGTVWQVAEVMYIRFQFGMARYNAIYGAMAQLPMLLAWVYLSWCIVLFGAELAFVHHLPSRGRHLRSRRELWVPRVDVALALLLSVARRFETGEGPAREEEIIAELGLQEEEANQVLRRLVADGLLVPTPDDPPGLLPARSPDRTPAAELVAALFSLSREGGPGEAFFVRLKSVLESELDGISWADLSLGKKR